MKSMTAYAYCKAEEGGKAVQVFLRSSNYRYLDINIVSHTNLSQRAKLEQKIRQAIRQNIRRGKIEVNIIFSGAHTKRVLVDYGVIRQYVKQIKKLQKEFSSEGKLKETDLLSLPEVINVVEQKKEVSPRLVWEGFSSALEKLLAFKKAGGQQIKKDIFANINRMQTKLMCLKKSNQKVVNKENPKEDINEEITLVDFYLHKLKHTALVQHNGPKAKTMEFLSQEILRELNTAGAKTKAKKESFAVVQMKVFIERVREQIQNIE